MQTTENILKSILDIIGINIMSKIPSKDFADYTDF